MSINASYKRYWEPSTAQVLTSSLTVGLAATLITQPWELVKTRIQQRAEGVGIRQLGIYAGINPHKVFREIHEQGVGFRGFYVGIETALLGRSVHLFVRNLTYKLIYDRVKPKKPTNDLTYREKAVLSGFAGSLAAIASNPFEVVLVRQQTEGALPENRRRGYGGFVDTYNKISLTEGGSRALFKGVLPHILKVVALNASFTGPYNWMKECMWNCFGDVDCNVPVALALGAASATFFTLPFDNLKFRYQYAFSDPHQNRINYTTLFDSFKKILEVEGWQSFWVGYTAFYYKVFLYGLTTVYAMDYLEQGWKKASGLKPELW